MRNRSVALIISALLIGLLTMGCGSDDDNGTNGSAAGTGTAGNTQNASSPDGGGNGTATPGSEDTDFVTQANAACAESNQKANAEIRKAYGKAEVKGASTEREAIALEVSIFVPILLGAAEAQAGEIEALDSSGEDENQINAILDAYEGWIEKAEATPFKVVIANDIYNEARELAEKYGLASCAESPFEL